MRVKGRVYAGAVTVRMTEPHAVRLGLAVEASLAVEAIPVAARLYPSLSESKEL